MAQFYEGVFACLSGAPQSAAQVINCKLVSFSVLSLIADVIIAAVFWRAKTTATNTELKFLIALIYSTFVAPWVLVPLALPYDQSVFDGSLLTLLVAPGIWLMPILATKYAYNMQKERRVDNERNATGFYFLILIQLFPFAVAWLS